MKQAFIIIILLFTNTLRSQTLPPKQAYLSNINQIHSGHSLTDPLFSNWPGQYVNLIGNINSLPAWQLFNAMVGKSTIPGSSIKYRWDNTSGVPDARADILNWELLTITERVPLLYTGGNTQQWYLDLIEEQKEYLSLFVNNAWNNGNNGSGAPTLLWTTWVSIDGSDGNFRQMLDIQGLEWEKMQDYANQNKPANAPSVYMIPGHKMMARLYDDIQLGNVPGITNINQFFSDNIHPNELGAYAVSLIHYACTFNQSPVGITNNLLPNAQSGTPIPSLALANYLQNMIWEVVTTYYSRTGIYANQSGTDIQFACDSLTWIDGNTYYSNNNSATYNIVGGAANSSDSLVTLNLTILNPSTGIDFLTACDSLTWIDGNTYYSNNNSATYNIVGGAANTCDSLVTLNLTINTINSSVTQVGATLTASESSANYQWLECIGMTIINDANNQSYTASNNGEYAVIVNNNECKDTSSCYMVSSVGKIESNFTNEIQLYPNPTEGQFTIDLGKEYRFIKVTISDLRGSKIESDNYFDSKLLNLGLNQPAGKYLITVETENKKALVNVIKK